jgi:uncharacterized membrane protein YdjX (TVP38/TMEM64 family)
MKHWLIITTVGRLPSVITSTVGGSLLNSEKYVQAIIIFALTVVLAFIGIMIYRRINKDAEENGETEPL